MCGRFVSTSSLPDLVREYAIDDVRTDDLGPRYNVAPTQQVYAVAERRHSRPGEPKRLLGSFRWGLVPYWAKDLSVGSRMINARAETVATKPAYRSALARRRCLIPANYFYEWRAAPGKGIPKQPFAIATNRGIPMAFAGLWETWRDEGESSEVIKTCVIITTEADAGLMGIHDRMPIVLPETVWDRWLDPGQDDLGAASSMLAEHRGISFDSWPVGTGVNDVRCDDSSFIEPLPSEPLPSEPLPSDAPGFSGLLTPRR